MTAVVVSELTPRGHRKVCERRVFAMESFLVRHAQNSWWREATHMPRRRCSLFLRSPQIYLIFSPYRTHGGQPWRPGDQAYELSPDRIGAVLERTRRNWACGLCKRLRWEKENLGKQVSRDATYAREPTACQSMAARWHRIGTRTDLHEDYHGGGSGYGKAETGIKSHKTYKRGAWDQTTEDVMVSTSAKSRGRKSDHECILNTRTMSNRLVVVMACG